MKKRRFVPLRCGSLVLLACASGVKAQSQPASNDAVAQAFAQGGAPVPQVVQQPDGTTKIQWTGGITADTYVNKINNAAAGAANTPLSSGTFGTSVVNSDLRGIGPAGDVSDFALGMTFSNDRAILSQTSHQVNNLQVGRVGPGYQLLMGDVAPNFSTLSSALGVRGLIGQRQFGNTGVSGYAGVVAESWEALDNQVYRNQLVRDAYGVKVDQTLTPGLKIYGTAQDGADRNDSITAPAAIGTLAPAHVRSGSGGFSYQQGRWQLAAEGAISNFEQFGQERRAGHAFIVDGSWSGSGLILRAGHHDIDSNFSTLSTAAQPGVRESYIGGDWTAASWVSLGTDIRRSQLTTLATPQVPSTVTSTDSGSVHATVNFGPNFAGWSSTLAEAESRSNDALAERSRNAQLSAGINYASPTWTSGFNYGLTQVRSAAAAATDSDTESMQLTLGRAFSNANANAPASWSLNLNGSGGVQHQHFLSGGDTSTTNYSFGVNGQHVGWGSINLIFTGGQITQLTGLPVLRQRGVQFEMIHPFNAKTALKLYSRDIQRNIGDPLSGDTERVTGVQLSYTL